LSNEETFYGANQQLLLKQINDMLVAIKLNTPLTMELIHQSKHVAVNLASISTISKV
jgi:hypothetical protein